MFIRLASVQYKALSIGRGAAPGKSKSGAVVKKKKTLSFLVETDASPETSRLYE